MVFSKRIFMVTGLIGVLSLVLHSSNTISKVPPTLTGLRGWATPNPGLGMGIQLPGGYAGRQGNLLAVDEGLPRQHRSPKEPPPALYQVQPASPGGNEHLVDPEMACQPLPNGTTLGDWRGCQ